MKEKQHATTDEQAKLQAQIHQGPSKDEGNQRAAHHGAGRIPAVIRRITTWWNNPPEEQYDDRAY